MRLPPPRSTLFPYTTLFRSQIWLAQNLISVGHAKVLLALKVPDEQLLAAETVLRRNATVRSTERMVARLLGIGRGRRSEEHTSELQSLTNLVCRLLLEKKKD